METTVLKYIESLSLGANDNTIPFKRAMLVSAARAVDNGTSSDIGDYLLKYIAAFAPHFINYKFFLSGCATNVSTFALRKIWNLIQFVRTYVNNSTTTPLESIQILTKYITNSEMRNDFITTYTLTAQWITKMSCYDQ